MADALPRKLKNDAIVEAILEMQFDTADGSTVPEIFFGRFADHSTWRDFSQHRLPEADIPVPMRRADEGLRYSAVLELREEPVGRVVRLGPQVTSFHRLAPYNGWGKFEPELLELVEQTFAKAGKITIRRLGLRYLNALSPQLHGVSKFADLNLAVLLGGTPATGAINVNIGTEVSRDTTCQIRVATKDFVAGNIPAGRSIFIDVDIATKPPFRTTSKDDVIRWVRFAHDEEKKAFFNLLRPETIEALRGA